MLFIGGAHAAWIETAQAVVERSGSHFANVRIINE